MPDEDVPTVSKKRWLVLFVVVVLNISNSMIWLSFASIYNHAIDYYQVGENVVDLFSLVFCISTLTTGLLVVWIIDKNGLRLAILVGACLNALGAVIRSLTYFCTHNEVCGVDYYWVAMSGQVLAALAQPFLYCVPTKVAEQWFPNSQRVLATSLAVMANLIGQLIACGVTPVFVTSSDRDKNRENVESMNFFYAIPCLVGALMAIFCITTSRPDVPPSNSAAISTNYPYGSSLKAFFSRKESVILIFGIGNILGVSYTLLSRMEEILCTRGYDTFYTGMCTVCLIGCGLLGATISSVIADRTRNFILIIKVCLTFMVISLCVFLIVVRYPDYHVPILVACGLVGFCSYAAFPVGLELAMEHSWTVLPEATSTGLIIMAGQLLSIIYFAFFETLTTSYANNTFEKCSEQKPKSFLLSLSHYTPKDTMDPLLILAGITTLVVAVFILFFKSDYNRMKTENRSMSAIVNDDDPIVRSASYMYEEATWHTSIYS